MAQGFGKGFRNPNSGIFTGEWIDNLKAEGELVEGQRRYRVEYDYQTDKDN